MPPSTNDPQGSTTGDGRDARIGSTIAERYRIDRLIGRGGMASVYAAHDTQLRRDVALKVFRPELADRDDMRRHEGEVRMLASLNHPGLVTLFDAVSDSDGAAVLVLELVGGGDLRSAIRAGAVPDDELARIGATIADALAYSHERGIIHRDVKPANILLPDPATRSGSRAKLADFGIARLVDETRMTAIGSVIGTAHYLSPEQALGGAVEAPTDVYSLGLVLLEALTGARSHPGTGIEAVAARLHRDPALPSGLRDDWAELLRGMTERDAARRMSASAAAGALRRIAADPAPAIVGAASDDTVEATVASTEPDSPAPTRLLPAAEAAPATAATEVLGNRSPVPVSAVASPTVGTRDPAVTVGAEPSRSTAPPHRPRRPALIGAAVVGALLLAGGIALGTQLGAPDAPAGPAAEPAVEQPAYPAVEGTIGEHLEQLQGSVAP